MSKYPKINYIGNKEKISDWIISCFPIKEGTILDLFSGGASLSYALKKEGFKVLSNDSLYSNYCISKAIIENSSNTLNLNLDETIILNFYDPKIFKKIEWMVDNLYFTNEVRELASLLSFSKTLIESERYLFLALLRRAMIRKLPYSRMNIKWEEIVKLRDEDYSYKKYKRRRAYHNKTFTYHIMDNLKSYNDAVFSNKQKNLAFQKDAFEMIELLNNKVDLIYIDPPYPSTMNKYDEFYGAFDIMLDKNISYSNFTEKQDFIINIRKIIEKGRNKTNYFAISLNNKSKPSYTELIDSLNDLVTKIDLHKREYVYQVTGKDNKQSNYEVLLVLEV